MENNNKFYFKFIGDNIGATRVRSFVVEVDKAGYERMRTLENGCYPSVFYGKVVKSKNTRRGVGEEGLWCNPFKEMADYGWPMFVRVNSPLDK